MNIERIKEELARTYAKIEKLQKKARDLEEQKKQAEDNGVSENYPKQWSFRRGTSVDD